MAVFNKVVYAAVYSGYCTYANELVSEKAFFGCRMSAAGTFHSPVIKIPSFGIHRVFWQFRVCAFIPLILSADVTYN